jgi:NAD(P)-dependent dehydrogenase (short-subunit alcohol dehydrogenase family)
MASLPVTQTELDECCRVLDLLSTGGSSLYHSPPLRDFRKCIQPFMGYSQQVSFGGMGEAAYSEKQAKVKAAAALRNRARQEDAAFLQKTELRAGRMQRLAELVARNGEGSSSLPLLIDGVGGGDGLLGSTTSSNSTGDDAEACDETTPSAPPPQLHGGRSCYTCKRRFRDLHHFYDALCPSCASFNWEKRNATADLTGRVALVTGARVKIGFHVTLKLLRCGARVVATSRFPRDAAARFAAQPDFDAWRDKLDVFGLDFRDLPTLEAFCAVLQRDLPRLDIVVNNACQTVRRPTAYYAPLMEIELAHTSSLSPQLLPLLKLEGLFQNERRGTLPSLERGDEASPKQHALLTDGMLGSAMGGKGDLVTALTYSPSSALLSQVPLSHEDSALDPSLLPKGMVDVNNQQVDLRRHNSWTMLAEEVGTIELAEVMAINTMAPFILCARLKPLLLRGQDGCSKESNSGAMQGAAESPSLAESILSSAGVGGPTSSAVGGKKQTRGKQTLGGIPPRPRRDKGGGGDIEGGVASHGVPANLCRFIVNVSSMEGKFYRAKLPTHPHTNMAKAGLNMLTRTCAGEYAENFIYMTAVDTGWSEFFFFFYQIRCLCQNTGFFCLSNNTASLDTSPLAQLTRRIL